MHRVFIFFHIHHHLIKFKQKSGQQNTFGQDLDTAKPGKPLPQIKSKCNALRKALLQCLPSVHVHHTYSPKRKVELLFQYLYSP